MCSTKREVNGRVLACVCERRDNDCGNEAYSLQLHVVCATLPTVQKCVPKNLVPIVNCTACVLSRFYRAMLCIRGTSRGPVTSRSSTKTAERIGLVFGM